LENPLTTSLVITAIGMSLLFLSLVLFYGILSLLTAITRERPREAEQQESEQHAAEDRSLQAAAIAIALARIQAAQGPGSAGEVVISPSSDCDVTSWWAMHHQQRLAGEKRPGRLG
jgi:Na+-transporting methylmalonyl-CoA/oxaloacetate decarboxylase gamma subunit